MLSLEENLMVSWYDFSEFLPLIAVMEYEVEGISAWFSHAYHDDLLPFIERAEHWHASWLLFDNSFQNYRQCHFWAFA